MKTEKIMIMEKYENAKNNIYTNAKQKSFKTINKFETSSSDNESLRPLEAAEMLIRHVGRGIIIHEIFKISLNKSSHH